MLLFGSAAAIVPMMMASYAATDDSGLLVGRPFAEFLMRGFLSQVHALETPGLARRWLTERCLPTRPVRVAAEPTRRRTVQSSADTA